MRSLDRGAGAADEARLLALGSITQHHGPTPSVAFSQFADTAVATFRGRVHHGGAALVTGRGARIASGSIAVDEVVRAFDNAESRTHAAMPLSLLIATDVLSEGLSLRRAGVLVHLDLPWTMARLEQRVGRLRRLGSYHRMIAVYAIGPPVAARELMPVLRALQRKARVASVLVGDSELQSSLPLLGNRLAALTSVSIHADASEHLRTRLKRWLDGDRVISTPASSSARGMETTLALIDAGGVQRLVAVANSRVTENADAVLHAVELLGADVPAGAVPAGWPDIVAPILAWIDEQRGRELARLATDSPSSAHATALRMLQELLHRSTRAERVILGPRVERCRQLVLAARGVGAERALSRLSQSGLDLDLLEQSLQSPARKDPSLRSGPRLVAVLSICSGHTGLVSGYVQRAGE